MVLEYWKNISSNVSAGHSVAAIDMTLLSLICIINIFPIIFLSLDRQQNNKLRAGLQHRWLRWCKYAHHGQFQATKTIPLNAELG